MRMTSEPSPHRRHRFLAEVIGHAVWLYQCSASACVMPLHALAVDDAGRRAVLPRPSPACTNADLT